MLYELVKNEPLKSGQTLRVLLLDYLDEDRLKSIENLMPTLTLFVPQLPENIFSAEKWNTEIEIPVIAMTSSIENGAPMFSYKGEEWVLPPNYTPAYPVIVVKENESIIENDGSINTKSSSIISSTTSSRTFCFVDMDYDNLKNSRGALSVLGGREPEEPRTPTDEYIPDNLRKVIDAYDYFSASNGWQRDYVYYNLTPTRDRGALDRTMTENIACFKLKGRGVDLLTRIGDADEDPKWSTSGRRPAWTDGNFEFKIKVNAGMKAGFGTEVIKHIVLKPSQLFEAEKYWVSDGPGRGAWVYTGEFLLKEVVINQPLFDWDLETISYAVRIDIEEVDNPMTKKLTETSTYEFAANFEYDSTTGDTEKVGFKFGSSTKETHSLAYEKTWQEVNDELGQVVVNFGDDIIIDREARFIGDQYVPTYNPKYDSGLYYLSISPMKMY